MSKYYCPECGADLEDQDGFDPEEGVWKCTNCGEVLYGDDIEETMSKFDGVIWYCDSCGAILNKQSGFEDDCGVWRCTECGYKNRISEDEIYDSEEDYQEHKSSTGRNDTYDSEDDCCSNQKIYECPYCGHELNNQFSFDADEETHTCTWCDAQLIKDDDEYKIQYICPHCGAVLNDQWRFQEERYYTCIECGTELYLSENKYVIDDEKNDDSYAGSDDDDDSDSEDPDDDYEYERPSSQRKKTSKSSKVHKKHTFTKKNLRRIIFILIIVLLGAYGAYRYWQYTKLTPIVFNSYDVIGESYGDIIERLKTGGFTNIHPEMLNDLSYDQLSEENIVTDISIGGETYFTKGTKYPYDMRVDIKYHSAKIVSIPISAKDAKGMQYAEVAAMFKNAGFGNITIEIDYDLVTGWINKEGEIEKITLNDNPKFKAEDHSRIDAEIVIIYHDYKKNKPAAEEGVG